MIICYLNCSVPNAAPRQLVVQNTSANSLNVSWQRPDEIDINGVLIRYDIEYFIAEETNPVILTVNVSGDTLMTMLVDLYNYTIYNVSVYAVTIDRGPSITRLERTSENGKLISFTGCVKFCDIYILQYLESRL